MDALNGVRTPDPLGTVPKEKPAYTLAGSFVGFPIKRHGLASFRGLCETGNYEPANGKTLGTLKEEWEAGLTGHCAS